MRNKFHDGRRRVGDSGNFNLLCSKVPVQDKQRRTQAPANLLLIGKWQVCVLSHVWMPAHLLLASMGIPRYSK